MKYFKADRFYCFSPPVMIATFFIELFLAGWTLYRFRAERVVQLGVALLVLLALFQLAEYNVCEGAFGLDSLTWSRIGYVAITFLPVLGIHMLVTIAKRNARLLIMALYLLATLFALYFLTIGQGLTASVCTGNYVIFEVNPGVNTFYAIYYYGLELLALVVAWWLGNHAGQPKVKRALYGLSAGYAVLIIPTTTVNLINPETLRGIPSVMCGFAVFLALIVTFVVIPAVAQSRQEIK